MVHKVLTTLGQDPDFVVKEDEGVVLYNNVVLNPQEGIFEIEFNAGLKGVYPSPAYLWGVDDEIVSGLIATDNTERFLGNNHLGLDVSVLAGSGTVTVTGDSIDSGSGAITLGDTENITVDATGLYQTTKRWLRVIQVSIPVGITSITYALNRLGYFTFGECDFRIAGYRFIMVPTNVDSVSIKVQIFKIQDEGDKKYTKVTVEDLTYKGTSPYIVDTKRGTRDYSAATDTLHKVGVPSFYKIEDFETYFISDENIIESCDKNEGAIVELTWDSTDYIFLFLRLRPGTGL